jgi:hypothetical protein
MRIVLLSLVFVVVAPQIARAGICLDDEEIDGYVDQLEKYAKTGVPPSEPWWLHCTRGQEKWKTRVVKACTTIVEKAGDTNKPDGYCIDGLAAYGVIHVGKHDTVAIVAERLTRTGWHDDPSFDILTLTMSKDARAVPAIAARLREHLATVAGLKKKPSGWKLQNWTRWRRGTLDAIKTLGNAADVALVDEIVAAATDKDKKKIATWGKRAKTAIAARPATP